MENLDIGTCEGLKDDELMEECIDWEVKNIDISDLIALSLYEDSKKPEGERFSDFIKKYNSLSDEEKRMIDKELEDDDNNKV